MLTTILNWTMTLPGKNIKLPLSRNDKNWYYKPRSIKCITRNTGAMLASHRYFAEVTGSNPVEALIFSGFFFPIVYIGKFTAMIILHF